MPGPDNNQWWTDDRPGAMWVVFLLLAVTALGLITGAIWAALQVIWWLI